jgi:parallel beta-helix repeat protein
MLILAFNIQPVKASGTIYIRVDGSIDPPDAPISTVDNITYTLTGNITSDTDGIVIERDNVVVDGADYSITGSGSGNGITFTGRNNVTVRNTDIRAFYLGIWLDHSSDCIVFENNITMNQKGIMLAYSSNNSVSHDRVETNFDYGISLYYSNQNNLSSNIASNNDLGFWVESSTENNISHNKVTANSDYGIKLVDTSSNNIISENEVMNQPCGIDLYRTNSNHVLANNITGNSEYGIALERDDCFNNTISENNVADNYYGIALYSSSNNLIYHNSFFNNAYQASSNALGNVWDDGYPSGGNYWSDYNGTDIHSGPYQNETGSDGIGDTPYVIDANNKDGYPLGVFGVHLLGDLNHDGIVDVLDAIQAASAFGSSPGHPNWNSQADLNNDDVIDIFDLIILAGNFGKTTA